MMSVLKLFSSKRRVMLLAIAVIFVLQFYYGKDDVKNNSVKLSVTPPANKMVNSQEHQLLVEGGNAPNKMPVQANHQIKNSKEQFLKAEQGKPKTLPSQANQQIKNGIEQFVKTKDDNRDHSSVIPSGHLCHVLAGGLGNLMFQFASSYALARKNNLKLVVKCAWLKRFNETFKIHGSFSTDWSVCKNAKGVGPAKCCSYDERVMKLDSDKNYILTGYLQSHKFFDEYSEKIKELFTFMPSVMKRAESVLKSAVAALEVSAPYTLIGVHIRRGDYLHDINKAYGFRSVTPEYLKRAREYMDSIYRSNHAVYVICSNDIPWAKAHFGVQGNEYYSEHNPFDVDLALLSLTDHMIMSAGTYSWWAGWFVKGTVVYWKNFTDPGTRLSRGYSKDRMDYFYPEWIGM